jgi:hypothetical protein
MSDPTTLARDARQRLAQGLAALQAPGVPEHLLSVAQPVAQAMGLLHQIESSHGAAASQNAPQALDTVRKALAGLQTHAEAHPAVAEAIASVAGSLNLVHSLTQNIERAVEAPPAQPVPGAGYAATVALSPEDAQRATAAARAAAEAQAAAQQAAAQQAAAQQAAAQHAAAQQAAAQHAAAQQAAAQQAAAQQAAAQQATGTSIAPKPGGGIHVEAALGAHSPTNFYKGLSGNDVIDSGGIFVATYQIPDLGTNLSMTVSMPGGYEFAAQAVVAWTREAPMSSVAGHEVPPGFGARFTEISQEGRQLVYRYVRNREPLFYDDL